MKGKQKNYYFNLRKSIAKKSQHDKQRTGTPTTVVNYRTHQMVMMEKPKQNLGQSDNRNPGNWVQDNQLPFVSQSD